ncbi:uncharacterized protein LOC132723552 [Ruditapes philippinarum]|uniref:uncharacterized protein LOC132723552 n=1 Tax=Ruditapes philippinarum TaxID=129788 RepID=UPI00295BF90B|nr:uncharacterized protein LOC132723552 [Ruditapes philippinarum]
MYFRLFSCLYYSKFSLGCWAARLLGCQLQAVRLPTSRTCQNRPYPRAQVVRMTKHVYLKYPDVELMVAASRKFQMELVVIGNIFSVDATLKYECAHGYSNTGSSFITCGNNGQWSSVDTCLQEVNQCPLTTNYQNAVLSDGTPFIYWLVQATYTQARGAALCQACQGRLVEILSYPKLAFLRNILIDKADRKDYWIDGSNTDAADYASQDAWTTASGAIIPLTSQLWAPNTPNHVNVEHCVRLKSKNILF